MKQKNPIISMCRHRSVCLRDATHGVYLWEHGESDVNLDHPFRVYCGQHKPRLRRDQRARIVRIVR